MSIQEIIYLSIFGLTILSGVITIIVAVVRGEMKKFIIEKMEEAEKITGDGKKKLEYVLVAVRDKYKVLELFLNVKKFIEKIISISKEINAKWGGLNYDWIWRC